FWGREVILENVDNQFDCDSGPHWGLWIDGVCRGWEDAEQSGVASDIRVAFSGWSLDQLLDGLEATVAGEGIYRPGSGEWLEGYQIESIIPSNATSGDLVAYLSDAEPEVDMVGRYLTGSMVVSTSGKLSESLPDMEVSLV